MHKLATVVFTVILTVGLAVGPARAALSCITDQQGADDEPGQKDLTELCKEAGDGSPFELHVTWNFDNTKWNGNNTGDACVLFDTNGNGFADAALCVTTTDGPPSSQADGSPRLFSCGDTRPDRCTNSVEDTNGFASTCTVNDPSEAADPFLGLASHTTSKCAGTDCTTEDAFVSCLLDGADLGGTEACVAGHCTNIPGQLCSTDGDCLPITDVCSYPSMQPNSDPSDCVISPTQQDPCLGVDCTYLDDDCNVGVCNPTSGECGADPAPADTPCGDGSSTACDAPDTCDGAGTCQPNHAPAGTLCRAAAGDCDVDDHCTGDSVDCPDDVLPAETECRPAAGDCDLPETCDGVSGLCPADELVAGGTVCRSGSGDVCDPDEVCSGVDAACPPDTVAPGGTVCNPGSGDLCDPDEVCSGIAGAACPGDSVASAGTVCNPGSGDLCDPDEVCSGVADVPCPSDTVASAGTVCRSGSGDLCDPDEVCSGVADEACPSDTVASAGTVCNPGSGDLCDPDEVCSGVAGEACPDDAVASADTVCRPGSGDLCDPDEVCSGVADEACPSDTVASAGTVCNPGSGDLCDPDEVCSGVAGAACPSDTVAPAGTVCNPGSGDLCDPDEVCSGTPDTACPSDVVTPGGTVCRAGSGDVCDPDEVCSGVADDPCPADTVASPGTVCREAGDACDVEETCTGTPGAACPGDGVAGAGTVCRDASGVCDVAEMCDGVGKACPTDGVAPQGSVCRADEGDCDVEEVCDGETKTCPADVKEPAGTPCADEGNVCTDDFCDAFGTCEHLPNDDPCNDFDLCTVDDTCVDGRCTGATICEPTCRTGGFWGTHGGTEKDGQNVTQAVIDAAPGGILNVCGELVTSTVPIGDLDSALEGLCVSPRGSQRLQLYRQLVTTALNCVMSDDPGCPLVLPVYQECNDVCALGEGANGLTVGDCIDQLDCFNNGGRFVPGVGCAAGECEEDFFLFCGGVFGGCPDVDGARQQCVPFPDSCHERSLCPSESLCFEPVGPASSTTACKRARGTACTIDSCD